MPVKFGLWRVDGTQVQQVPAAIVASEERLEEIIEARIDILGLGTLFQIGRQVITDYGKRIDILAIDAQGDLHVVELKKDRTPREVVAQTLEYGFWIQGLSFEAIRELYAKHHQGDDFDSAFTSQFETDLPEAINTSHHLVVVATGMARPVRSRLRGTASTSSSRSGRTSIETGMTCVAMASSRPAMATSTAKP